MKLFTTAIAITSAVALMTLPTLAADKWDGDAWLKLVFHGKPGELTAALKAHTLPLWPAEPIKKTAK